MKWIWCLLRGGSSCVHQYCVRYLAYVFPEDWFLLVIQPIVLSIVIVSVCDLNYPHVNVGFGDHASLTIIV